MNYPQSYIDLCQDERVQERRKTKDDFKTGDMVACYLRTETEIEKDLVKKGRSFVEVVKIGDGNSVRIRELVVYLPSLDDLWAWMVELSETKNPIHAEGYGFKDFFYWWNYNPDTELTKRSIQEALLTYALSLLKK